MNRNSDGIYYFIGNIASHVIHALPLYKKIGGTFVVTSHQAQKQLTQYNLPAICLDNVPFLLKWNGKRVTINRNYTWIGQRFKNTVRFLESHADVVITYEMYDFAPEYRFKKPKLVFLTHGNMLKNYMNSRRMATLEQYDYMAALGPYLKRQFIADGVPPEKLLNIGIARTDDIIAHKASVTISQETIHELNLDQSKPIISYMPTYWGASSIYTTGKRIIQSFPPDLTLLFRPHPQTPKKIIREYEKLMERNSANIIYCPEGRYKSLGLLDIFRASSVIIGDYTSVMLEAILTEKPLIFAESQTDPHGQSTGSYDAIQPITNFCEHINESDDIKLTINKSITKGVDTSLWKDVANDVFFDADSASTTHIANEIMRIKS